MPLLALSLKLFTGNPILITLHYPGAILETLQPEQYRLHTVLCTLYKSVFVSLGPDRLHMLSEWSLWCL